MMMMLMMKLITEYETPAQVNIAVRACRIQGLQLSRTCKRGGPCKPRGVRQVGPKGPAIV
eukprot:11140851-Lingulodinium_polyedra.AAC.1